MKRKLTVTLLFCIVLSSCSFNTQNNNKTLFEWALMSLSVFFSSENFIFVARQGTKEFICERAKHLGIKKYCVLEIDHSTAGQAETALIALNTLTDDESFLIFNIDTHLNINKDELTYDLMQPFDGWLQTFKAPGDHWSFVKLNSSGEVTQVTEKNRISEYASTGLYYFKSSELFKKLCTDYRQVIIDQYKEFYVAPLYQYLLQSGGKVGQNCIDFNKVIPLGTPREVSLFDTSFKYE